MIQKYARNIYREDPNLVQTILDHVTKNESVVIVGERGIGKTTLLDKIAKELKILVTHVSEVNDPYVVGNSKLPPLGGPIIVDEASRHSPHSLCPTRRYSSAVIGTHHQRIGIEYAQKLSGDNIAVYLLQVPKPD